ncbi:MAG: hypothetical protein RLZZ361_1305 [Cyanobacteriota bacterium]|jgi:hypothetical protein
MADEKNPEEKPSFFDFADSARSWPPADGFDTDDQEDVIASGGSFFDKPKPTQDGVDTPNGLDQILSIEQNTPAPQPKFVAPESPPSAPQPAPPEPPNSKETDLGYIDMLLDDFSSFREMRNIGFETGIEPRQEEDFLVPKPKENKVVSKFDEESSALDDIFNQKEIAPSYIAPTESTDLNDDDDGIFSISDLKNQSSSKSNSMFYVQPEPANDEVLNKALDSASEPLTENQFSNSSYQESSSDYNLYDDTASQPEPDENTLPFRTYSSSDYTEEKIEEGESEEDKSPIEKLLANRNLVILLVVIVLFMGYFIYNKISNRQYVAVGSKRGRRPPPKKEQVTLAPQQELVPVWEISSQEGSKYYEELKLVKNIYSVGGRDNPFAMPDSIVADLKKRVEADIIKKQQPNNYRRIAYRATLIGVLASKDSMIALVNQQEADFDVLEGTGKVKVLKLATKAMERAKQNTQEMVVGSYIGPWVITKIDSPENAFVDAKVHVEYRGIVKVLSMGKATELGIFTSEGLIDNLENPVGTTPLDKTPVNPSEEFDSFEE